MSDCWVFYLDGAGGWRWERHGADMRAVAASTDAFPDCGACVSNAIHQGYQPLLHEAIFPPDCACAPVA